MTKHLTANHYKQMALEIKDLASIHKPWYNGPLSEMCEDYCSLGPLENGLTPDPDTLYSFVCKLSSTEAKED